MANIDILRNAAYVQNQGALGQAQGEQRLTRRLAGQVIGGDPQATAQLAAINPAAAQSAQGFGDDQVRRFEGLINFMDQAEKSGNPAAAQQAWQAHGAPYVRQFANGTEPTQNWSEAKAMLEPIRAKIAMVKAARANSTDVPTGFRELDLKLQAAGYVPGTPEYQNAARVAVGTQGRAASGGFSFEMVKGPDGRERPARRNPRTGDFEVYDENTGDFVALGGAGQLNAGQPAPRGAPTPAPQTPPLASNGANYAPQAGDETAQIEAEIGRPLTQDERATIAAGGTLRFAPGSVPPIPASVPVANTAPPAQAPAGAPSASLGVSRSPEEQAAATEAATQAARTAALAEQERIKAEAGTRQAVATEAGKVDVGVQAKAEQKIRDAAQILSTLDEVEKILPQAAGGLGQQIAGNVLGAVNITTPGRAATAALAPLAARLVGFVPRFEGPQSDKDVQLYRDAAGDFANESKTTGERLAALEVMRRQAQKALDQARTGGARTQVGGDGAPVPGTIEDGFRFKGGNPADPNSWEAL